MTGRQTFVLKAAQGHNRAFYALGTEIGVSSLRGEVDPVAVIMGFVVDRALLENAAVLHF